MAADRANGVWLASRYLGRIWYYKSGQLTPYGQQFGGLTLLYLNVDDRNCLWVAFNHSLWLYDGQTWQHISLPLWDIYRMTSGPDGRIWVAGRKSWATSYYNIATYDPATDKQQCSTGCAPHKFVSFC
jgi:hypothetical protein